MTRIQSQVPARHTQNRADFNPCPGLGPVQPPLEAYEAVPEDRFWEDAENPLPPESKHRLGLIADVDMVRFEPLGIRIMRGCYNLLFRLSGGRFPAGGRIIGLK